MQAVIAASDTGSADVGRLREFRLFKLLNDANILSTKANAATVDASAVKGFVPAGPKLLCCAKLLSFTSENLDQRTSVLAALTGHSVSPANDAAAATLIRAKLVAARDVLPTTLAQDRAELVQLQLRADEMMAAAAGVAPGGGEGGGEKVCAGDDVCAPGAERWPRMALRIAEKQFLEQLLDKLAITPAEPVAVA